MTKKNNHIRLFRPYMGQEEIDAVAEVLKSGWIGLGPKVAEFEKKFGNYEGSKAVALNSCTAALDMALRLCDIGYGDEVIVPTMTFVSTAHAVCYQHATPIFADIEPDTLNIDWNDVEKKITPRTKAIIPVHYGGRIVDTTKLWNMLDEDTDITVIGDCAHAAGSYLRADTKAKQIIEVSHTTHMSCFSFHAVKNLAVGDGGMLVIPYADEEEISRPKMLRWLGIDKGTWDRADYDKSYWWEYHCDEIGYKNHMNDISAAIGLVQLQKLDKMNQRRKEIADQYFEQLLPLVGKIHLPQQDTEFSQSSWHIFHIYVPSEHRDNLASYLKDHNIDTGVHYKPIHLYKCYGNTPSLPVAETIWKTLLSLPMHPALSNDDVSRVCNTIKKFIESHGL